MNRIINQSIKILTLFYALFYSYSSIAAEGINYPQFLGINLDEKFWILIAFLLFIILVGKKATKAANFALDNRSNIIKDKINHAEATLHEAKKLLKDSQDALRNYKNESDSLKAKQKDLALKNAEVYLENLKKEIKRKNIAADKEIQYMHDETKNRIQNKISAITIKSVEDIANAELKNQKSDKILANFIKNIPLALSSK